MAPGLPFLTGDTIDVHALGTGEGLRLRLQAVGRRAAERADPFTALAPVGNSCTGEEGQDRPCVTMQGHEQRQHNTRAFMLLGNEDSCQTTPGGSPSDHDLSPRITQGQ